MKKVLFASTALIATAGVAAADISFGGYGRFGLQHQENRAVGDDTIIESRFRLNIDVSTESDAGVTFGARLRIQADEDGTGNARTAAFNGARFHAETGGFRLEVGNISHALDNLSNFYGFEPGLIAAVGQYSTYNGPVTGYATGSPNIATAGFTQTNGNGAGVNGVSAIYSMGDFRGQLSYDDDTDGTGTDVETVSASVAYTFSGWTVALGYETSDDGAVAPTDVDGVVLTVGGSLGVADVAFFIGDADGFDTAYGVSGRFDVGAATAIVASIAGGGDADSGLADLDTAFGIGFDHDLGGGVALRGMLGRNTADNTVADLGVQFNF